MEYHWAANLFPLIMGEDFSTLVEDIRANGQKQDIDILDGKVLDGRNRLRACNTAGVEPRFRTLPAGTDPIRYVVSANIHRRHLTESQRGMIAAEIANMRDGQKRSDTPATRQRLAQPQLGASAELHQPPISQAAAAAMMQVGIHTVSDAKKIIRSAAPEVADMVKAGDVTVKEAARVADLPKEEQQEAAREGPPAVKEKAREVRHRKRDEADATLAPTFEAGAKRQTYGVGITKANEAINSLKTIPRDDQHRIRGFQIVRDWMRHNP